MEQHEGGVALANNTSLPEKIETSEESIAQIDSHNDKEKTEKPTRETAREKRKRQQLQRQHLLQLLNGSTSDCPEPHAESEAAQPAAVGEAAASSTSHGSTGLDGDEKGLLTEVKDLRDHNRGLKSALAFTRDVIYNMSLQAETMEEEMKVLRAENRFAQLEVGHCHAANAYYRGELEDENPARTAHMEGLLKRKDEAYAELEMRAAECAEALAEETKQRAIDKVWCEGRIQALRNELAHRVNIGEGLAEGKRLLKEENDEILRMFKSKIFEDDMAKAFQRDYEVVQKDNALLINMIKERKGYVLAAEKQVVELKVAKVIDDHVAARAEEDHRRTQQELNGLIYVNSQLTAKVGFVEEIREELKKDLEGQLQQKTNELDTLLRWGADECLQNQIQAQSAQIASLNAEVERATSIANQWHTRALEHQRSDFCHLYNCEEVGDFGAEETRWRLVNAERENEELKREVRDLREVKGKGMERGYEHDGSRWLRDRAEARMVMEEFRGR